ncbi:Hypothetical predicted protein [Mytilus galloprovincialis]|uniref:Uncharacterized protein n=1 Tax=Mytilus galloprovincialis TaxID=29158 RepID=A0A8B6H0W3_MYTGA|nr:Hypothetical predicted protein [Mytilus galloprovincialis]
MDGDEAVAIVGIGCRFPGADSIDEFWRILINGEDHIKEVPNERWNVDEIDYTETDESWKNSVKYAGLIDEFDKWDNKFFGIGDNEAGWINPQTCLTLEVTHSALENGGFTMQNMKGSNTGVYIGVTNNDMMCGAASCRSESNSTMVTGINSSLTANRISNHYDLRGPSLAVDTACSSSMTAVYMGCQAIRSGECDMAICGGVNSILSPGIFIVLAKAKMTSPSGKSHPFADDVEGYVRGEGCGVIVLKKLNQALTDKDKIWGTIACGCNQNGKTSTPIIAPSSKQQRVLLEDVYRRYKVDPSIIQYVEAHGAGTPVGDPIEMRALSEFFGPYFNNEPTIAMGSVKSNIGHLESAAAIAGLIKTLLMINHGRIVQSLHYTEKSGNSNIDFKNTALKVATSTIPWPVRPDGARYGSINSFGFGGSNGHAIVKKFPTKYFNERLDPVFDYCMIAISGTSIPAVMKTLEHMKLKLGTDSYNVQDLSYTSLLKREHFNYRVAIIGKTIHDISKEILNKESKLQNILPIRSNELNMIFFFGGVGTVWTGTCQQMLNKDTFFRRTFIRIDEELQQYTKISIIDEIKNPTNSFLTDSFKGPLIIFACQVSLFHLWRSLGILPNVIVGQSVGEVAAAHAAGVLTLKDAVKIIFYRSSLSSKAKGGRMMVVGKCDIDEIERKCETYKGKLCIAVYSSKEACVISGDKEAIEDMQEDLKRTMPNTLMKILDVNCAYHSYHMDDASAELPKYLDSLNAMKQEYEIISTVTGKKIESSSMTTPMYWAKNLRQPVLLSKAVSNSMVENKKNIVLELGPKPVVKAHLRSITNFEAVSIPSLNQPDEIRTFVSALSSLFECGYDIQFEQMFHGDECLTDIPQYKFNRCKVLMSSEALKNNLKGIKENTKKHLFVMQNVLSKDFTIQFTPLTTPYIYQHIVEQVHIAPGAVHAEIALEIARCLLHLPTSELEISLRFVNRLRVDKNHTEKLTTQADQLNQTIDIKSNEKTICKFEIKRATRPTPCPINITRLKTKLEMYATGETFYSKLNDFGFHYGEDLSVIKDCRRLENQYLVAMEVSAKVFDSEFRSNLIPVILDGAFQTTILSFDLNVLEKTKDFSVPVSIQSLIVHKQPGQRLYVLGQLVKTNIFGSTMNMLVINENGDVAIEMIGCELQNVSPNIPDNPLKNKFYEMRWQPVSFDRKFENDSFDSNALIVTVEAKAQQMLEKYLPDSKGITVSSHSDEIYNNVMQDLYDYVMTTFGNFQNISEIVYCPRCSDFLGKNMSPEDIFNTVKTSCVILTKLCQKLIHEKVDVVMYVLTKQTQPKVNLQDNGHVNILGSELWGMARCLMREEVFTKLFLIDFEEESDLICLQEVINNEHNKQSLPSELKFEKQCIYSSTLMRSTIDEPNFRMNKYNANDALELKSEKYNKITRPFFRHAHLSKHYEGSVELEVMSTYTDELWFPVSLTEIVGGDDPWKLYCTNGHQLLSAETCGKSIHRSTTNLKTLEVPHSVHLHEEYVTCYPVHASNFVVVPEDCILEKIRFPNYQPGILLQIVMFFSIADEISKLNPIAIFYDETVATIHVVHLLECILDYTGRPQDSTVNIFNLAELESFRITPALQIIFLSTNVDKLETILIENNHSSVEIFSFTNLISRTNERPLRYVCPSLRLKLVNNEEVLQRHNLSKLICLIKQWLVTDTAVGMLQKIPIACGNSRTFCFDTKDKNDIKDTVRMLDVASKRNDLFGKHSSYIVVGGLTGLGQEIVKLICELGGGAVFIFGRRNPSDEQTAWMRTLMDTFICKIEFVETDITDILSLKKAFDKIKMKYSNQPIKGVFQGAAVLDDGTILNMTELKLDKVLRPKVLGTWNLHMVTKDMDLDYFVLHSSTASAFGNVGQLNYGAGNSFMDAVSFYRQSTGLSGQTINWGPLQLGLMKVKDGLEQFFESQGYNSLTRTDIRECFLYILMKNSTQVICGTIDWKTVIRQTADISIMSRVVPILRELRILDIFAEISQFTNTLMDTDDLLKLSTKKQIQETIRITSVIAADVFAVEMSILTPSTNLVSIGMDSMKGLEFVNSINKRIHVRLPVVSVIAESATIESISNLLLEHLQSVNSKPGQVPVQKLRELRNVLENFRTPLTDIEKSYVDPITDMKNADSFVDIQLCVEKNLHETNLLITCLEQIGKLHPFVLSEYYIDSGETYRILQNETMLKLLENIEAKHRELNLEFYRQPRNLDLLSGEKFDFKILIDHDLGLNNTRTNNMKKTEKLMETRLLFASKSVREDDTQLLNLRFRRFYFDFRSIEIFVNDLFAILSNDVLKESNKLQQNKYSKTDVIERMLCSTDTKMEYWRSKLGNNYQPMCLPNFDQAKSSDQTMIIRRIEIKGKIIEHITKWTLIHNSSIKDLFLTAYQLLLHFMSTSETPSVVTNVDLREEDGSKQYEGPLETLIPIIANVDKKDKSVQEFVLENLKEIKLVTSKFLISHSVIESLSKDRGSLISVFKHAVLCDKDISQELTSSKLGIRPVQVVSVDSRFSTSIHVITDCTQSRNWLEFQCHPRFADEVTAAAILNNLLDVAYTIVMDQSISLQQLHEMFIIKIKTDDKFKNVHFGTEKAQLHENNVHRIRGTFESEEIHDDGC